MAKNLYNESILDIFSSKEELDIAKHKTFKYPSFLPMMKTRIEALALIRRNKK
jgi:hypothetical protein